MTFFDWNTASPSDISRAVVFSHTTLGISCKASGGCQMVPRLIFLLIKPVGDAADNSPGQGGRGLMPLFGMVANRGTDRAEILHSIWSILCAALWVEKKPDRFRSFDGAITS